MKKTILILGVLAVAVLMVSSATAVANTQSQTIDNMVEGLKDKFVDAKDNPNDPQPTFILLGLIGVIIAIISMIIIHLLNPLPWP